MFTRFLLGVSAVLAALALARAGFAAEPKPAADTGELRAHAQDIIENLVAGGETDVDALVDTIAGDNMEQLDHIVINIATQKLYECNAADQVLRCGDVSSGRKGFDTPPGNYEIHTKSPKAYSQKYTAWMLNWLGFTEDGNYGIHGLEGSSYERHLGHIASHGCVRVSRKYAKDLYTRAKVGMPVIIVNDSNYKLPDYQPLSREAALNMVLEVISPADPHEIFY